MNKFIEIPAKKAALAGEYDVAVIGGGFGGVAAALSAARNGARTCLIEKYCVLGGLGTAGNVVGYLALCDGRGRQVSYGLAEELLLLPMKYSGCRPLGKWGNKSGATRAELSETRYEMWYNPGPMMLGMEDLAEEAGVDLFYECRVTDVLKADGGELEGVVIESSEGCSVIRAKAFVDASGDAVLCNLCGESCEIAKENRAAAWYFSVDASGFVSLEKNAVHPYNSRDAKRHPPFSGLDNLSVRKHILLSHSLVKSDLEKKNAMRSAAGEKPLYLFSLPSMPEFRMTRRLEGKCVIKKGDEHKWHEDTVGIFADWRKAGPVYALPLRALAAVKTPNLFTAGRCISSTGDAWDVTRVIPVCSVSGQAAGAAAADMAACGETSVSRVQEMLRRAGVRLDPELVEEIPPCE